MKLMIPLLLLVLAAIMWDVWYNYVVFAECHAFMPWWFCLNMVLR